jgi:hypothetical protein
VKPGVVIYSLCAVMSAICFALLLREYIRKRSALLLWISFCFFGLFLSNAVLILDRFFVTGISLAILRVVPTVFGLGSLIYGLTRQET